MKKLLIILLALLLNFGLFAQESVKAKISSLDKVETVVEGLTTSSSEGSDDFPVYQYGVKKTMHFDKLYMLLVRHDIESSNPDIYITVELVDTNMKSTLYEMVRLMRVSGKTSEGRYSIKLQDVNSILIVRKGY